MDIIHKIQMRKFLQECDESDLSDMLNLILIRWHELQPEWEHYVFAVPLYDAEERRRTGERVYREMSQPRPEVDWDTERMWKFYTGER